MLQQILRSARWEGLSLLLLLFIGLPLKYACELPGAVTLLGGLHGALFLWYAQSLFLGCWEGALPLGRAGRLLLLGALPLGFLLVERRSSPARATADGTTRA